MKLLVFFLVLFFTDEVVASEKQAIKTSLRAVSKHPTTKQIEKRIRKRIERYSILHYLVWTGERYLHGKIRKRIWKGYNTSISAEYEFRHNQQLYCEWQLGF